MTFLLMRTEVILGDRPAQFPRSARKLDLEMGGELRDALQKIQLELTRNIIRENLARELALLLETQDNAIVDIAVPFDKSATTRADVRHHSPFALL